ERSGTGRRSRSERATPAALPPASASGRRLAPGRRWPVALVEPSLFPPVRRPGRLLPQAAPPGVLAALPALLHLGAAGDPLSPQHRPPGFQHVARRVGSRSPDRADRRGATPGLSRRRRPLASMPTCSPAYSTPNSPHYPLRASLYLTGCSRFAISKTHLSQPRARNRPQVLPCLPLRDSKIFSKSCAASARLV